MSGIEVQGVKFLNNQLKIIKINKKIILKKKVEILYLLSIWNHE